MYELETYSENELKVMT